MSEPPRKAEWLTREEAERALARREGWVLSPAFFRRAKVPVAVGMASAGLLALAIGKVVTHYRFGDEPIVMLAVSALALGLIPLAYRWEKAQHAAGDADRELREAFGRGGQFVALIVRQGDAPTGEDRGILWFEDGRLYFSGHRTSFGLVPDQIKGFAKVKDAVRGVRNELNLALTREGPAGPMSLSFGPATTRHGNPDYAVGGLKADLDRWYEGRSGRAPGPGQWPPATVGPGVVSEWRLLGRALARSLVLPLVPVAFVLPASAPIFAEIVYGLGMVAASVSPTGALLWRAWRDRRRLRRAR